MPMANKSLWATRISHPRSFSFYSSSSFPFLKDHRRTVPSSLPCVYAKQEHSSRGGLTCKTKTSLTFIFCPTMKIPFFSLLLLLPARCISIVIIIRLHFIWCVGILLISSSLYGGGGAICNRLTFRKLRQYLQCDAMWGIELIAFGPIHHHSAVCLLTIVTTGPHFGLSRNLYTNKKERTWNDHQFLVGILQ